MRQILGLGVGTATFTPGPATVGMLVIAGMAGFSPARLLAVTNITRKKLIYAAEATGKAGTWTDVTAAGGTLTLDASTQGHQSSDVLRCIYEADVVPAPVRPRGGNLWPIDLDACALASGNARDPDYGAGSRPGLRSTRFVLSGDNEGANTGALTLIGRTDGAMFGLAVDIKGSGTLELRLRAVGSSSGVTETVGTLAITADSTWRRHILRGYVAQYDCATIQGEIRATGGGATIEACAPDLRLLEHATDFPEYQPPQGAAQSIYVLHRLSTSFATWGDSMAGGSAGGTWRTKLVQMLGGCVHHNGGYGGQISTYVKDQFVIESDTNKKVRAYGVTIFCAGTNNVNDPNTVIADIDAMIAYLRHGRWLVVSMINSVNATIGTGTFPHHLELNRRFLRRYGARFVDLAPILRGGLPHVDQTFMYDGSHLNEAGLGMEAHELFKAMLRNNFLEGTPMARSGVILDPREERATHQWPFYTIVPAAVSTGNTLLAAGIRKGFRIVNDTATGVLYVSFGYYASGSTYIAKLAPGGVFENWDGYCGQVTGYWTVADGNARVTEVI